MNSEVNAKNLSSHFKLRAGAASVVCSALIFCSVLSIGPSGTTTRGEKSNASGLSYPQRSAATRGVFLRTPASTSAPDLAPAAPGEPDREDLDGRDDWFYFQRTYPSSSIPRNA